MEKQNNIKITFENKKEIKDLQHALLTILEQLTLELETPFEHHNKEQLTLSCYWVSKILKITFEEQQH